MTTISKLPNRKKSLFFFFQLLCLLTVGVVEFLLMAKGKPVYTDLNQWILPGVVGSLAAFWVVSLWRCPRCLLRWDVCLGIAMAIWVLILELVNRGGQTADKPLPLFLSIYLMVLPFAAVTEDSHRQTGIRAAAGVFLAGAAYLLAWSLVLLAVGGTPELTQRFVRWREGRLNVIHHPNTMARIFMIAICLCLGFLEQAKERLSRGLLLLFAGLLFGGLALTNSRACTLVTCLLLGGNVFFRIWKGGRKGLIPALAAAAAVAAVSFLIANGLFRWQNGKILNAGLEAGSAIVVNQGSWSADLPSLNNRTVIWAGALKKIQNDPWILLRGAVDTKIDVGSFVASHSHNAWMETLLRLGVPGLLLSLIFSWRAGWTSLRILWHTEAGPWKKNIAMLALAMMVTSMLEPFLFVTNAGAQFFDYFFFVSLGYLTLWSRELKKQR